MTTASKARIVLGSTFLASYPEGGGHWMGFLQYLLGLRDLGHEPLWLEMRRTTGDAALDQWRVDQFLRIMGSYGLSDNVVVCLVDRDDRATFAGTPVFGAVNGAQLDEWISSADMVWNLACSLEAPLLARFKKRVLIDGDPGVLQVSALACDMGIQHHEVFLTVGQKVGQPDCEVPTLGVKWHTFRPLIYLPMWSPAPAPGASAPFTTITQWNWGELAMGERLLSVAKRDAYMRYFELPRRCDRAFEIAANIDPDDASGDRETITDAGWRIVDPHTIANSPQAYQQYLAYSRAEVCCPKPIYRELRTGWFSDRSASYLATGRPVLAEDTGFSEMMPTGNGLLCFRNVDEAVAGVKEIDANYAHHSKAARELAVELFDARKTLTAMLAACG